MNAIRSTKKTTGLTGLAVSSNPQHKLDVIYQKTLRVLQNMPETAAYRKHTESIIKARADIVKKAECVEEFEGKINGGQAEELIVQANNELLLARAMLECKAWEPLATRPPADQWIWPPTK